MNMNRQSMVTWGTVIILLITWEFVGHMKLVGGGTLPALSTTLIRLIRESSDYWPHIQATLKTASSGFFFGNILALFMATVFCLWPITERLFRGVNIAIFTVPPIAIVPVLVIALDGNVARITLATLLVYFPTMSAALAGMQTADSGAVDLIRVYGGNKFKIMRLLRVRAALPQILSGFQIAAPAAMLGAILAEFGSGARWGLGTFLLGSLGRAEPDRLWGIGLTATAISGLGYVLAAVVANRITGQNLTADLSVEPVTRKRSGGRLTNLLMLLATICLPFLLWHVLILLSGLSPIIAKSPENIIDYMFFARTGCVDTDNTNYLGRNVYRITVCLRPRPVVLYSAIFDESTFALCPDHSDHASGCTDPSGSFTFWQGDSRDSCHHYIRDFFCCLCHPGKGLYPYSQRGI
jgi:sulfonate transport system permease protein